MTIGSFGPASRLACLLVLCCLVAGCATTVADERPDISTVAADLVVPDLQTGEPAAGKRVKQTLPGYPSSVYHIIYLPTDWHPQKRYPVIVEYAGNGPYSNKYGDLSSGRPEGSKLGYGISAGRGFIWVCLPYLRGDGRAIATSWWGDRPTFDAKPTLDYCKRAVPWVCERYGGRPDKVVLTGFSRGAIACNYLGLHDDEIARLWAAFIPYSHYDGVVENWPYPDSDRQAARVRLERLGNRPQFICHEQTDHAKTSLQATREYLESSGISGAFQFRSTGFRNHNDAWLLRPSPVRTELRKWLATALIDKG